MYKEPNSLPIENTPRQKAAPYSISTHDPACPLTAEQQLDLKKGVLDSQTYPPKRETRNLPKLPPIVPVIAHSQGSLWHPGFAPVPS